VDYEYTYRGMNVTNPSGLRIFTARFFEHCRNPAIDFAMLWISRTDERYGFRSLDEMLASPLLDSAARRSVRLVVKSGQQLYLVMDALDTVSVSVGGMEEEVAKSLVRSAQQDLGLQPTTVESRRDRSAFLGHSFDHPGELVAGAVRDFLGLLGFRVVTGESYSPRGVSVKIKDRIRDQAVTVCVLTARRGTSVDSHRASQWVLDEATVAEALEKPLFLLIEDGVEAEIGIHGDREYIRFTMATLHDAMIKLLQGLRELGYEFEPGE
jgi:hypothetical protein